MPFIAGLIHVARSILLSEECAYARKTATTAARPAATKEPLKVLAAPVKGTMVGEMGEVPLRPPTPVPDGAAPPLAGEAGTLPPTGDTGTLVAGVTVTVDRMVVGMQVLTVMTEITGAGLLPTGETGTLVEGVVGWLLLLLPPTGTAGTEPAGELPAGDAGALLEGVAGLLLLLLLPPTTGTAGTEPAGEAGAELGPGAPPRAAVTGQMVV